MIAQKGPTIPHFDCLSRNISDDTLTQINAISDIQSFCIEQAKDLSFKRIFRKNCQDS